MKNSIVKLEDCQLDEISGGITAKQIAKKAGAYAIKGTCAAVTGVVGSEIVDNICCCVLGLGEGFYLVIENKIVGGDQERLNCKSIKMGNKLGKMIEKSDYVTVPLFGVGGWKLGEYICQKIGLED